MNIKETCLKIWCTHMHAQNGRMHERTCACAHTESNPDITSPSLSTHRSLQIEIPYQIIFQLLATLDVSSQTAVNSGAISLFHTECVCVCVCVENSILHFLDILTVCCLTSPWGIPPTKSSPTPTCSLSPSTSMLDVHNHYELHKEDKSINITVL